MRFIYSIVLFLLISNSLPAKTYYIAPTGSNSNDGSFGLPWLTLSYACSHATTSGDIIHVNAGTYIETAKCTLKAGVSIEGEGDASRIISHYSAGGKSDALIYLYSASVTSGNQSISYIKLDGDSLKGNRGIYTMNRNNVQIHHCTFVDFKESGVTFDGYGRWAELTAPVTYLTGNSFYNNTMTNCSNSIVDVLSNAALYVIGQQGFLLYNNTITSGGRASGNNGELVGTGNAKGLLCHDNIFNSPLENAGWWNFVGEWWNCRGGIEVYNNVFNGAGTFDIAGLITEKTTYDFAVKIHDNEFINPTQSLFTSRQVLAICLEAWQSVSDVYVYNNHIRNFGSGVQMTLGKKSYTNATFDNIYIYNNIIENVGYSNYPTCFAIEVSYQKAVAHYNNINIWNNVISGNTPNSYAGIKYDVFDTHTNISIRNNVIQGFTDYSMVFYKNPGGTVDGLQITNNICYKNGNNAVYFNPGVTPANYISLPNYTSDPLFVSPADFHLKGTSPAIGAGINVGLTTDKDSVKWNIPPSIGVFEYHR